MRTLGTGFEEVGHVELRSHLPEILDRVALAEETVALTNRHRVEAVLVNPVTYERLAIAEEKLSRMRSSLPIIVAAIKSGVAFPSESLRGLIGSDLQLDWQRMNAFQATFPVATTHDEEGQLLPSTSISLQHQPIDELDDELHYA